MHRICSNPSRCARRSFALACLLSPVVALPGHAVTLTWDGSIGDWDNDASWLAGGTEPTLADDALINAGQVDVTLGGE